MWDLEVLQTKKNIFKSTFAFKTFFFASNVLRSFANSLRLEASNDFLTQLFWYMCLTLHKDS